jgi:hypothetical protein
MPVPTNIHKHMQFYPQQSDEPRSFVILNALTVKSNASRRLLDKMATAQGTTTSPQPQTEDTFTAGEAGRGGYYILHARRLQ